MDWIKLHKYGRDVFLDYPNRIVIEPHYVEGKEMTMIHDVNGFVFDESPDEILAMIQKPEPDTELRQAVKELITFIKESNKDVLQEYYHPIIDKVEKLLESK